MVDLEKALKGLEMCTSEKGCDSDCPYWNNSMTRGECLMAMQKDALGLLKETNTVEHALTVLRANEWKEDHTYPEIVWCKDCKEIYYASNRAPAERAWVCGKHGIDVKSD